MEKTSGAATELVIRCCPQTLEFRDAVACSEVPAFRYGFAPGQVEQQMAEHGTSVACTRDLDTHLARGHEIGSAARSSWRARRQLIKSGHRLCRWRPEHGSARTRSFRRSA